MIFSSFRQQTELRLLLGCRRRPTEDLKKRRKKQTEDLVYVTSFSSVAILARDGMLHDEAPAFGPQRGRLSLPPLESPRDEVRSSAQSRRAAVSRGRARLWALREGRPWPNADSGGTGTDSGCVPDASRMRLDASGCVGILNSDFLHQNSANSGINSVIFGQNLA